MLVIPFTSDPAQDFTVALGEAKYRLEARYNDRSESWTLDITRDADEEILVVGVPMLIGQDILKPYALGIGGIVVTDLANTGLDAGPDDLGSRVIVTWFSEDELDQIPAPEQPWPDTDTAAASSFLPSDLGAKLKLWLRSDNGVQAVAGAVSLWQDMSGNANHVSQADPTKQPTLISSSIGGRPGLVFAGGSARTQMRGVANLFAAGAARHVFAVLRASGTFGGVVFCFRTGAPVATAFLEKPVAFPNTIVWGSELVAENIVSVNPPLNNIPHVAEWKWPGGGQAIQFRLDGVSYSTTGTASAADSGATGFDVGDYLNSGSEGWAGEISELIVTDPLTVGEAISVRQYIAALYGLAVA